MGASEPSCVPPYNGASFPTVQAGHRDQPGGAAAGRQASTGSWRRNGVRRRPLYRALIRPRVLSRRPIATKRVTRSLLDRVEAALSTNLCERIPRQWRELRAVEMVVPLLPELRDILGDVRATLADRHRRLRPLEPDPDLPEPDEETLDSCRRLAYRNGRRPATLLLRC